MFGAATEIPAVWLEGFVQRIRDRTTARSKVDNAITETIVSEVAADDEVLGRAYQRLVGVERRRQENVEAVVVRTIEHLSNDEPGTESTHSEPDADWMNLFESHAEKASSDKMRDLFGRVLAGEIRKSGTYSLRTLDFMATLDGHTARTVEEIARWACHGRFIFQSASLREGIGLNKILIACDVGILRHGGLAQVIKIPENGIWFAMFWDIAIVISGTPGAKLTFKSYPVTDMGREVFSLITPKSDITMIDEVIDLMKSQANISELSVFPLNNQNGGIEIPQDALPMREWRRPENP